MMNCTENAYTYAHTIHVPLIERELRIEEFLRALRYHLAAAKAAGTAAAQIVRRQGRLGV